MNLSIIIPTLGRDTLLRTWESIYPQLEDGDRVWMIADGMPAYTKCRQIHGYRHEPVVVCCETQPEMAKQPGGSQRNAFLNCGGRYGGDYLLWIDDDDVYLPGALAVIRGALAVNPGVPHLFRMKQPWGLVWADGSEGLLIEGNVGTPMIVAPNIPEKLGRFGNRYEGDFDFIQQTVSLHGGEVIWRPEVIVECRPKEASK